MKAFSSRDFIRVKKVSSNHMRGLEAGDIILKQGQSLVTRMSDLHDMFVHQYLKMSVIRRQILVDVDVPTIKTASLQSNRVVWFAGAQFESPYSPIALCTRELYSQIFLTRIHKGSPAHMYDLQQHHFVTEVQGVATVNLDHFIEETNKIRDGQFCQLTLVDLQGSPKTVSLMLDRLHFQTFDAQQDKDSLDGWHFQALSSSLPNIQLAE